MDNSTPIVVPDSLQIFEPPSLLESYVKTTDIWVQPSEGWKDSNQILFQLPYYEHQLYETSSFEIHMTSRITHPDGTVPTTYKHKQGDQETTKNIHYAPCNGFGQLAFYPTIKIGDTFVWGDNKNNLYSDYLWLKFGHSKAAKETWMKPSIGYYEDKASKYEDTSLTGSVNDGFENRHKMFAGGRAVNTIAKLNWPLAQQNKLLIPNIKMTVILNRTPDQWLLQVDPNNFQLKFDIIQIRLKCRIRIPQPEVMNQLTRLLVAENKLARYFFHRYQISGPYQLETNKTQFDFTIFRQTVPLTAFVFAVETTAAQGNYSKNSLHFVNPFYSSIWCENEGEAFPSQKYILGEQMVKEPEKSECKELYLDLYKIIQQRYTYGNCDLSWEDFIDGCTIIPFQFAPNAPDLKYIQEKRTGDTRLCFTLREARITPTNLFVIGCFENQLFIDFASGVIKDYVK